MSLGYHLVGNISWVKLTRTGKLKGCLGYYLQHCRELAKIFQLWADPKAEYNDILMEANLLTVDDLVLVTTRVPSG